MAEPTEIVSVEARPTEACIGRQSDNILHAGNMLPKLLPLQLVAVASPKVAAAMAGKRGVRAFEASVPVSGPRAEDAEASGRARPYGISDVWRSRLGSLETDASH
jgi:hypothetical protein